MHPISGPLDMLFGLRVNMGYYYDQVCENSRRLNAQINKYIQRRKNGLDQSKMQGYDLLSVFLEDQNMFPDDKIVQNIIGFIFAAIETSQFTTQTIISYLAQKKSQASLTRLRQEFKEKILQPALEEDPSLASLPKRDLLNKVVTMEAAQDLDFATMVLQESLRFQSPA